jgi:hypothetical protein
MNIVDAIVSSAVCIKKTACFSHLKTRVSFCQRHVNNRTQQCILHAARSHGLRCSVTTHADNAALVQG